MSEKSIFPMSLYIRKFLNTFFPKIFFKLSPNRNWAQRHWKSQSKGDIHGFDKYTALHPRTPVFINEIQLRGQSDSSILDLGCNCGFYLSLLKKEGYRNLSGIDISAVAIQYGKENFDLKGVMLTAGSFEETLPKFNEEKRQYDIVYTLGATIELVHPAFDIIGFTCKISKKYVILIINEWDHAYPRFWEYEFSRNGFLMIKCIRPYDGKNFGKNFDTSDSLLVFQRF
jgi:SAM-dependent methyltransferase